MLTFKELMATPGPDGETDDEAYLRYRAQKRRRNVIGGTIGGPIGESKSEEIAETTDTDSVDEALNLAQRRQRARKMRIAQPRIQMGRKRAMARRATPEKLKARAEKLARRMIFKKLAKGKTKDQVSFQMRQEIEKRMEKMTNRIKRLAIKLLPKVRELEKERKAPKQDDGKDD